MGLIASTLRQILLSQHQQETESANLSFLCFTPSRITVLCPWAPLLKTQQARRIEKGGQRGLWVSSFSLVPGEKLNTLREVPLL